MLTRPPERIDLSNRAEDVEEPSTMIDQMRLEKAEAVGRIGLVVPDGMVVSALWMNVGTR